MPFHKNLTGTDIHVPHAWSYADSTARDAATGFILSDVGKLALQLDDFSYWTLTSISPITWQAHGAASHLDFQGDWNADTNSPVLSDNGGGGNDGDIYRVSVSGTTGLDGNSTWNIGDLLLNSASAWERIPNMAEVHIADTTSNPHGITTTTIGAIPTSEKGAVNGVAELGADGKVPAAQLTPRTLANIGANGVGVFAQVVVNEAQFRKINPASNKISVTENTSIDLDVVPGNIAHSGLSGAGSSSHAQIDVHLADTTSNPHSITAALAGAIPTSEKGVATGVATLDSGGKVPISQLTFTGLEYAGLWNADTNTPTLSNGGGGGTSGQFYVVSVDGTTTIDGVSAWFIGDWALNDGTSWSRVPATAPVTSVNGYTGEVVLTKSDLSLSNVTNDAQLKRSGGDYSLFTEKVAPDDGDLVLMEDANDSYNKKKAKLNNLPYLWKYGDTLTGDLVFANVNPDHVAIFDATNALKDDNGYFEYHPDIHVLVMSGQGDDDWTDPVGVYGQVDTYLPNSLIDHENDINPGFSMSTSRGTGAAPETNANNDFIGHLAGFCYTNDPADYYHVAEISMEVEGATSNKGGRLIFGTKPDGSGDEPVESMRINAAGRLLVGQTTDDTVNKVQITGDTKITGNLSVTGTVPNATDTNAIHKTTNGEIAALTAKATPVAADVLLIEDSAASNAKKKVSVSALQTAVAPVFGMHFSETSSDGVSSITGTTAYQQKVRLSVTGLTAGKYRIGWHFAYALTNASSNFGAQVQLNDAVTLTELVVEPKDAASSQTPSCSGFSYQTLTAGNHFVDLDYKTYTSGYTAYISKARLEIWRVS